MTDGRRRELGKNMKPRGVDTSGAVEVPVAEVQEMAEIEPISGDPLPVETDVNQEPEKVSEPDVAVTTEFSPPPAEAGLSALEELIKASNLPDTIFSSQIDMMSSSPVDSKAPSTLVLPTAEEIEAITTGDRLPEPTPSSVGPQTNGDYGVVVVVAESMVSGVLGQAEMDGVSPSEWLSVRVGEYLDQWFFGR